jgi:TolA-binding protein/predicted Ser/Thr protein kinase
VTLSDSQTGSLSSTSLAPTLGKYKIIRVIARSNDVVYEAIDPGMNRRVAVKELALSPNLTGHQRRERIERFYREAKAAGNLSHPNIVTVHEVGQEGDRHYIAMEYLEGPSLRDILRMRNSLSIREALTIALQLTEALGYAHSQGVVHRDVKPDNIHLIVPNDQVKLTDFGIARILSDPAITSTGQVFGTPSYMSPEQIMSKEVDHRTDIFSLGVVLFEMIAGKKPFVGDSVITITYHIMNTQPSIPTSIPPGVYNLISRALTKDPAQRYQNMASMAADLHSEIAFSDSPYHRTIPPGALTAKELSAEQTAMVDRGELPRHAPQPTNVPLPSAQVYAPPTGIADAISGGPVGAATSVTPMNVPHATPVAPDNSVKSALTLVATVVGVVLLVLVVVFAIAVLYKADRVGDQTIKAVNYYTQAMTAMKNGQYQAAESLFEKAYDEAPAGTPLKQKAQAGMTEALNSGAAPASPDAVPDTTAPATSADTAQSPNTGTAASTTPNQSGANPSTSSAATPGTDQTTPAPAGRDVAQSDYNAATGLLAQGDQNDAITQLEGAADADPTGPVGMKAATQVAQIYSDRGDEALQAGQKADALDDWRLVVKYAPADALANDARQKILQYGSPDSSQNTDSSP